MDTHTLLGKSSGLSTRNQFTGHRNITRAGRSARPVCVLAQAQPKVVDTSTYTGRTVTPPAKGKHFLHLDDFTKDELQDMLDKAQFAKKKLYARDTDFKPFKDMSMAMIFTKPSARTRVSFETVSINSHTMTVASCAVMYLSLEWHDNCITGRMLLCLPNCCQGCSKTLVRLSTGAPADCCTQPKIMHQASNMHYCCPPL